MILFLIQFIFIFLFLEIFIFNNKYKEVVPIHLASLRVGSESLPILRKGGWSGALISNLYVSFFDSPSDPTLPEREGEGAEPFDHLLLYSTPANSDQSDVIDSNTDVTNPDLHSNSNLNTDIEAGEGDVPSSTYTSSSYEDEINTPSPSGSENRSNTTPEPVTELDTDLESEVSTESESEVPTLTSTFYFELASSTDSRVRPSERNDAQNPEPETAAQPVQESGPVFQPNNELIPFSQRLENWLNTINEESEAEGDSFGFGADENNQIDPNTSSNDETNINDQIDNAPAPASLPSGGNGSNPESSFNSNANVNNNQEAPTVLNANEQELPSSNDVGGLNSGSSVEDILSDVKWFWF